MRRRIYRWVTGRWFPTWRLAFWSAQIPPAITLAWLNHSVQYLVFLSIAALVESALTDVIEGWKFEREQDNDNDDPD